MPYNSFHYVTVPYWYSAGNTGSTIVAIQAKGTSNLDQEYKLEQTFNYVDFSTIWPLLNYENFARAFEVCV